jgi:hypothetical protein
MNAWQPVVLFTNGPPPILRIPDFISCGHKEKTYHPWQQPVAEAEFLIERLTRAGDLVVDGCLGSGTVAVACRRLRRRFVVGDIDPVSVRPGAPSKPTVPHPPDEQPHAQRLRDAGRPALLHTLLVLPAGCRCPPTSGRP